MRAVTKCPCFNHEVRRQMYKSRSSSMQRGSHKHDRGAATPAYSKETPPRLTDDERIHFGPGDDMESSFVARLKPAVRAYAKNGFRKPSDVSRLLNKANIATACGAKWTPRLAWFLLGFLFQAPTKSTSKHHSKQRRLASDLVVTKNTPTKGRSPLTAEEKARRLAVLRRGLND
jgi:hypothetical protein